MLIYFQLDSLKITGDYDIIKEDSGIKYTPKTSNSLLLNGIPMSFISIISKNRNTYYKECKLLYEIIL